MIRRASLLALLLAALTCAASEPVLVLRPEPAPADENKTVTLPAPAASQPGQQVTLVPRESLRRQGAGSKFSLPAQSQSKPRVIQLPTPPDSTDWSKGKAGAIAFPLLGNDKWGDCYYTTICHAAQAFTAQVGPPATFDTNTVVRRYLQLSPRNAGLNTDVAMSEYKAGIVGPRGPHRILDEMDLSATDTQAMQTALGLFGPVAVTMAVPDAWLAKAGPGVVWDAGPGVRANMKNGHAVLVTGRDAKGVYDVQTWGLSPPVKLTAAGVTACDADAVCMFSAEWFDEKGYAPNGYHYTELALFWQGLGGKALPPSPFPPPPGPGPNPPAPPPAPAGAPVYDVTLTGNIPGVGKVTLQGTAVPRLPAPKEKQ